MNSLMPSKRPVHADQQHRKMMVSSTALIARKSVNGTPRVGEKDRDTALKHFTPSMVRLKEYEATKW